MPTAWSETPSRWLERCSNSGPGVLLARSSKLYSMRWARSLTKMVPTLLYGQGLTGSWHRDLEMPFFADVLDGTFWAPCLDNASKSAFPPEFQSGNPQNSVGDRSSSSSVRVIKVGNNKRLGCPRMSLHKAHHRQTEQSPRPQNIQSVVVMLAWVWLTLGIIWLSIAIRRADTFLQLQLSMAWIRSL